MKYLKRLGGVVALLMLAGCYTKVLPSTVKTIGLCTSTKESIKEKFGPPDKEGRLGNKTTWTYVQQMQTQRLELFFDEDDRLIDLAYQPAGLYQMENRCR